MNSSRYVFRLYITGNAPNSLRAVSSLTDLCRTHLVDRHQIEIVDLLREPQRALSDRVYMTPTLIKLEPAPQMRIVGSLTDLPPILASLGLNPA